MTAWSKWSQADDDRLNAVCNAVLKAYRDSDVNITEFVYVLEAVKFDLLHNDAEIREGARIAVDPS